MRTSLCLFAGLAAACLAGCGAPVVEVVHELPPAVPLPPHGGLEIERGGFRFDVSGSVAGVRRQGESDKPNLEALVSRFGPRLAEGLRRVEPAEGETVGEPLKVGGRVRIRWEDEDGTRRGRRNAGAGAPETVELPYLVRRVNVGVELAITPPDGAEPSVVLETRAAYDSAGDPEVRGEYGLHRADDPERVPALRTILDELFGRCIEDATGMLAPVKMPVTLRFRPVGGSEAAEALKAAGERDFAAAAEHFRAALEAAPEHAALHFNLGLALEGAGDFAEAAEAYRAAGEASSGEDAEAQEAHRRAAELHRRIQEGEAAES